MLSELSKMSLTSLGRTMRTVNEFRELGKLTALAADSRERDILDELRRRDEAYRELVEAAEDACNCYDTEVMNDRRADLRTALSKIKAFNWE